MGRRVGEPVRSGKVRARPPGAVRVALCWAVVFAPWPSPARAQRSEPGPTERPEITLTLESPALVRQDGFDAYVAHVGGVLPLRTRVGVFAGVSVVHARQTGRPHSTILSNLAGGFIFGSADAHGTLTFTLPTSGRLINLEAYAADAGLDADLEVPERFTNSATGVSFVLHRRARVGAIALGGRGGLAVSAPAGFRREFYARYGGFVEREWGPSALRVEVTGAAFLNAGRGGGSASFSDSSVHHWAAYIGLPDATLRPRLFGRFPLDAAARRRLRSSFGLQLTR